MAPSRFQRLLRLKAQLRKAAGDELAALREDLAGIERAIAAAEAAADLSRTEAARVVREGRSAMELHLHAAFERAQQASRRGLQAQAAALEEVIESRRATLIERRKEERQFELLEDRHRVREAETVRREEERVVDDLARGRSETASPDTEKEE
jgi:flagellar export protein FliJ